METSVKLKLSESLVYHIILNHDSSYYYHSTIHTSRTLYLITPPRLHYPTLHNLVFCTVRMARTARGHLAGNMETPPSKRGGKLERRYWRRFLRVVTSTGKLLHYNGKPLGLIMTTRLPISRRTFFSFFTTTQKVFRQ
jgi:hypothetical protein